MDSYKIIDWLNELGDKAPTPGGGAVSGLNGSIAAAQLKMVCEYTKDELIGSPNLDEKIKLFLELSQQDSQAYLAIKEAYKSKDNEKIQQALLNATKPSNEVAINCQEIFNFCEVNLDIFNKNLLSDLVVSLANLSASVESAQAMLKVNASSMDEGENKQAAQNKIGHCETLISKINSLKNKVKREKL